MSQQIILRFWPFVFQPLESFETDLFMIHLSHGVYPAHHIAFADDALELLIEKVKIKDPGILLSNTDIFILRIQAVEDSVGISLCRQGVYLPVGKPGFQFIAGHLIKEFTSLLLMQGICLAEHDGILSDPDIFRFIFSGLNDDGISADLRDLMIGSRPDCRTLE